MNLLKLIKKRCLFNLMRRFFQIVILTFDIIDILLTFEHNLYRLSIMIDLILYKERMMYNTYRLAGHDGIPAGAKTVLKLNIKQEHFSEFNLRGAFFVFDPLKISFYIFL